MKKFFFNNSNNDSRTPFWQPWGLGGFLGRLLGFTLLLLALILLLRLFRNYEEWCDPNQPNQPPLPETPWHKPIEGGEEIGLPSPDDNKLPDFGELEPITNPGNGDCETYPGLLYIVLKSADNGDAALRQFAQQFSTLYPEPEHKIVYYCVGAKTCMVSVPEANRMEICSRLPEQITGIELIAAPIERLGLVDEAGIPNDPALSDQVKGWHFDPIQARQAWTVTTGSPEIVVGIVDSYMDLNHPELAGNRCIFPYSVPKQSTDIAPNPNVPEDVWGHGTLVTATAVGNANNGEGSTGIAPSCKYIPVSLGTNLNTAAQAEGILYCIYNGADVAPSDILSISGLNSLWGKDMDEALIAIKDIKISSSMITVYRKTTNTLKITLPNKVSLMKFNATDEECDRLQNQTGAYIQLEIVGKCNTNEWMGNITPQVFIEAYDITGEGKYLF